MMRTHTCGQLRKADGGQRVTLCGWVDTVRDHGGLIFIDLRDRYGRTQVLFDPQDSQAAWDRAQATRPEFVIRVEGVVESRPADMVNPQLATGDVEVRCSSIEVLNRSLTPPFPLEDARADKVSEDLRMTYRYLDLRRPQMQKNLELRHRLCLATRTYMSGQGFLEIETPILTKSTPEGARDYLVPSRVSPGKFFALPQAPQQYKQLLMMSGVDRYFQIAKCFRDEDLRADRQPEFSQIDIEMSFISQDDIFALVDGLLAGLIRGSGYHEPSLPLPRLTYREAMDRFGSDKPDLRFGMEIQDVTGVFASTGFKVFASAVAKGHVIKALNVKGGGGLPLSLLEEWTGVAKEAGLAGLAHIRIQEDGTWKSPITKFLAETEIAALREALGAETGDLLLFAADRWALACEALGRLRLLASETMGLVKDRFQMALTWVTDFPLFERTPEGRLTPMHHPFTAPHPEDIEKLDSAPDEVRAQAYDITLNGVEVGGGSIRIHTPEMQARMFELLGLPEAETRDRFGHLIAALGYGAPPHGGVALGLDRLVMLMAQAESIRDVMAFPKNQKAQDLLMGAPSDVDPRQLRDVALKLDLTEAPELP